MTTETVTLGAATVYDRADRCRRIWAIFASSSGNLVEWFDFYAYAFTALYFAPAERRHLCCCCSHAWSRGFR